MLRWKSIAVLAGLLAATPVAAQETIYLLQEVPSEIRGYTFDGTSLAPHDVNPDPAATEIFYEAPGWRLAATDHWFVVGVAQAGAGVEIVDANGVDLPPPATSVAGNGSIVVSADERYAFTVQQGLGAGFLGVVDIDPQSPTFLEEIVALDVRVGGAGETRQAVLSADGQTLYLAIDRFGLGSSFKIQVIDISNPPGLGPSDILATIDVPVSPTITWDPRVSSMRRQIVDGRDLLLVSRHNLLVLEITGPTTLVPLLTQESTHPVFGTLRFVEDAWAFLDGTTTRAMAVASSCEWDGVSQCLPTGEQEILAVDLTPPGNFDPVDQVTRAHRILSPAGEAMTAAPGDEYRIDDDHGIALEPALEGQTVFVLSNNPDPGADPRGRLMAFDVAEVVDAGGSGVPAEPRGGSVYVDVLGFDHLVRNELTAAASPPVIALAEKEGGGQALENDAPRAVDVIGTLLSGVTHAFLGRSLVTLDAVGPTTVDLTIPALVPTGNPTLGLVAANGAVGTWDGLAVVPPADFLPGSVAYVPNTDETVTILNASTSSSVNPSFPALAALNDAVVSPDGRYLALSSFRFNGISVHCVVLDATTQAAGCPDWNAEIFRTTTPGLVAAEMATKPDRSRAYVNTIWPTVEIVDLTSSPPALVGSIEVSNPAFFGAAPTYLTRGLDATATHLYLGADGRDFSDPAASPHVVVVDVTDDLIDPASDISVVSIPALAGLVGRADGVRIHPDGTRLYYSTAADPRIWILDIATSPTAPPVAAGPTIPDFPPGEVINMTILPDGRFLYAAGRVSGKTHIYDLGDKDNPALVGAIDTGQVSNILRAAPNSDYVYVPVASLGAVAIIDARPGSPTLHQILSVAGAGTGAGAVAISTGLETPTGAAVEVEPSEGASVTFANVSSPGTTTVTAANVTSTPPPANFEIAGLGVYYDVTTTATFSGDITLCFDYDDSSLTPVQEANLRLLHEEKLVGSNCDPPGPTPCWDDVTAAGSPDVVANELCGTVTSLSLFVAATQLDLEPPTVTAALQPTGGDDDSDGESDEGTFLVTFSATDDFDPEPVCEARLAASGCGTFAATVGQLVEFEIDDEECEAESEDGVLEIEGPSLVLEVTCTDSAGRSATAQAVPPGLGADNDPEDEEDD